MSLNPQIRAPAGPKADAVPTVLAAGLIVGILDGLAACISSGLRGVTPDVVWHYVASSLIGRDASYSGGLATVLLGLGIHFCVAIGSVAGYVVITRVVPGVLRHPFIAGPLWGLVVYFLMAFAFVPMTLAPKLPFNPTGMLIQILIHIVCVGLPPALLARHFARSASLASLSDAKS